MARRRPGRSLKVPIGSDAAEDGLPALREVVAAYGLDARKALGQHFLYDLNLTGRIARAAGPLEGVTVLEIGPGPGGLTRALLAAGAARVIAVERDPRCLPALAAVAEHYPGRLAVVEADALTLDAPALAGTGAAPLRVVANLPYNVGTALLVRWLTTPDWPPWWASLTLMFQKEVAERIVARPEGEAYGRLAILAQWRSRATLAFTVHRSAFVPPPKVMSAVVHIVPAAQPEGVAVTTVEALTAAAFGQRRKMLRQSLKGLPGALDGLAEVAIDAARRAETLSVDEFVAVARAMEARR